MRKCGGRISYFPKNIMKKSPRIFSKESRLRSFVKTLIYRFLATIGTGMVIWCFTKDIKESIFVTVVIHIFLMMLYYINERVWNKINWGKEI